MHYLKHEVSQQPDLETDDSFHQRLQLVPPQQEALHHQNLHELRGDALPGAQAFQQNKQ
jgi:hypothetical protein